MAALALDKETSYPIRNTSGYIIQGIQMKEQTNALESTLHGATTNTDARLWYNTKLKGI
jgi:hypothetical protein